MKKLIIKLLQKIRGNNMSFKNIIRNYTNLIVDLRNKLLNSIGIKFDEWINIRSTNDDKLIYKVAKEINRLFR
jgi:plasmid maintenance system antidote protein VapI